MAVANARATGHYVVPPPQLRSSPENLTHFFKNHKSILTRTRNSKLISLCSHHSDCRSADLSSSSSSSSSFSSSLTPSSADWDWNRWSRHFSEIEQAENYASVVKFQLEDAIEKEDFHEAAKLKIDIAEATSKDSIAEIMSQLKSAIDEERYHDASRLSQTTGSGLVGWWVGYSKDSDDPFGRIIRITPGTGRFIGKTYSPRQLVTSSPGTPLFEIFVVRDGDGRYNMQVAFLKETKMILANSPSTSDKSTKGSSSGKTDNTSLVDMKLEESESEKSKGKSVNLDEASEEGIKGVINFLKEKIPELKVKVTRVEVTEDIIEDTMKQYIDEDGESRDSKDIDEGVTEIDGDQLDRIDAQGDSDIMDDETNLDTKLYIGGILHNNEQIPSKDDFVRVPADIKDMEKDSFVLHIPKAYHDNSTEEEAVSKVKVAAIAAQGLSELMPSEIAKAFWSSGKVSPKVSKDVREIVKLAVSQAQKRNILSEYSSFSRITVPSGDLDPFEGLYVGAFGPYGTEVVQLRRKFGNWNTNSEVQSSDIEFFEYVEAVKLTGDLNVPAGEVIFRAKIGKVNRTTNRGMYPPELGVVASYKGQGRIAEFGFKNPKWVEGELLQLNDRGLVPYVKGADLGFFYTVPDQSFLVLFNRLMLPKYLK